MLEIIDTFPDFLSYWNEAKGQPLERQIESWKSTYMASWPELLQKQINDYESDGFEWRDIARERIFPTLDSRLPEMRIAHKNLLAIAPPVLDQASQELNWKSDIVVLVYVGIGLGAGWATSYGNRPAILFGLENIAECGWIDHDALSGLVAHEFGHLTHFHRRKEADLGIGSGPWWQLYTEGYAMRCEQMLVGEDSWHMRDRGSGGNWLEWCKSHTRWLAAEFLRRVQMEKSVTPFFGSWYDLQGYRQTGYYLGHELIRDLESEMTLDEITLLSEDDPRLMNSVTHLAEG
jgi:hypothetical protein